MQRQAGSGAEVLPRSVVQRRALGFTEKEKTHSMLMLVRAAHRKRTGAQWRYMPHDLPDWQLVYHYFAKWKKDGTWRKLNDELRRKVRKKE